VSSRTTLAIVAWLATAITAAGAGLAALSTLGAGITDRPVEPMSLAQVEAALAEPLPATPRPSPVAGHVSVTPQPSRSPRISATPHASPTRVHHTWTPRPRPTAVPTRSSVPVARSLNSEGGTVLARCEQNLAYLVSWTPMQGYSADNARRGPALFVSVQFESRDHEIKMIVSCRGGRPYANLHDDRSHDDEGWDH
jgi:hypothetical protein